MAVLLLFVLLTTAGLAAAGSLPATFVVLPLSSFADATLVSAYSCSPTYSSSPCSGHGSCYLLLDSAANTSQQLLNQSTAQPTPVDSSAFDTHGIDSTTPLPAAVCICDSGWAGRGDYLSHHALDGDSCDINEHVTNALCSVGIFFFALLILLALHRLSRWLSWYRQCADGETAAALASQLSSDDADEQTKSRGQRSRTKEAVNNGVVTTQPVVVSPRGANAPVAAAFNYTNHTNTTNNKPWVAGGRAMGTNRASGGGGTRGTATNRQLALNKKQNGGGGGGTLWAAMAHISFCHPLLSIIFAITIGVFFLLRITTGLVLGESYVMSALFYVGNNAYFIGICVATYHMLRLAATITRTQTGAGGLSAVMRRVRFCMRTLVAYNLVAWLLVFALPSVQQAQQITSILILTALHLPVWSVAILSLTATRRITAALILNIDKLSAQQREARLTVCRKLRSQANVVTVMVTLDAAMCLMLVVSAAVRQAGMPYFHLLSQYFCWLTLFIRLLLIQPPGGSPATIAPRPLSLPGHVDAKLPMHSPSASTALAAAAAAQARQLRLALSAGGMDRQPMPSSRVVSTPEEEDSKAERDADSARVLVKLDSSSGTSEETPLPSPTNPSPTKPRLSIVIDAD